MAYTFVQQAEGSNVNVAATAVTSAPIVNTANNLLVGVALYNDAASGGPLTDTQGDIFTQVVAINDSGSTNLILAIYTALAKGGSNTYTLTSTGGSFALAAYVAEYTVPVGATLALNASKTIKTSNGSVGANNIATALLGNTGDNLLFSFALNTNKHVANSAGTSPVAFSGRAAVWSTYGAATACAIAEDAEVLSNSAATWGTVAGGVFDPIIVVAAAISLLLPASGSTTLSGAGVSGVPVSGQGPTASGRVSGGPVSRINIP